MLANQQIEPCSPLFDSCEQAGMIVSCRQVTVIVPTETQLLALRGVAWQRFLLTLRPFL